MEERTMGKAAAIPANKLELYEKLVATTRLD